MSVKVIGFYRKKDSRNLFQTILLDPTFYILVRRDDKVRELVLKLSGRYPYHVSLDFSDFEHEAYKNFVVIERALLGDNGENIRVRWGLSKKDFRELTFELYFNLLNNYATCGEFRKGLLLLIGLFKYYTGRRIWI